MKTVISRRGFLGRAGAVAGTALAASCVKATAQEDDKWSGNDEWLGLEADDSVYHPATSNPDPTHVIRSGRGWRVLPTGGDDHDNLEWALCNTPSGGTVRLAPGTYKLGSPILVPDFDGALVGAGTRRTTMTCTDEFSYELWEQPGGGKDRGEPPPPPFPRPLIDGSTTRAAPALLEFYKTPLQPDENPADRANRIAIRNFRCRGAMKGALWAFGDEVLCINVINSIDWHNPDGAPATTRQDVNISNIEVDGYSTPSFGPFGNACACITILGGVILTSNYNLEGDMDGDALGLANGGLLGVTPAEGNVTLRSCTFKNCRQGPGVVGYRDGLLRFQDNTTDGCRGNCLQVFDVSGCRVLVNGNDLRCDSFILPPEFVGGQAEVPSSLGCVVALQGMTAALGMPSNLQWHVLANDPDAHARHPEAGPLGTWRPLGPAAAPRHSVYRLTENQCESSLTPSTYCLHLADAAKLAFGFETASALIRSNGCEGSETCIGVEHIERARVVSNDCSSQAYGVELHNSPRVTVADNHFEFPLGVPACEIRVLGLGDKIDFSRVVPGAGACFFQ